MANSPLRGLGGFIQRTQYYPSGLPWAKNAGDDTELPANANNRKYNGKEFVEMHGLDEYDSEARWYYPAIMRTTTIDPLAEMYYSISPYAWCGNNPVKYIDPDGRAYGDPESGGTPAKDPELNNKTGKIEGGQTTAQSTIRTETPTERIEPIMNMVPNKSEVNCSDKLNLVKQHNQAMSSEIGRAIVSNPVLKAVSVAGAVATGSVIYSLAAPSIKLAGINTTISTLKTTQNVINGINIYATGAQVSTVGSVVVGGALGFVTSYLGGHSQDIPQITTGNPIFDNTNQGMQLILTATDYFNSKNSQKK